MTIAANDRLKAHTGDGTTTDFSFDFPILSSSEIRVTLDVSGVQTVQTIATHYTVTIAGDGTGTVSFVTAPASGTGIYFEGVTEVTQTAAYANADRFPASAHEGSMDKFAKILQEIRTQQARTIYAPLGQTLSGEDIEAVSEIAGDVTTVADNVADISAVADIASDITSLATSSPVVGNIARVADAATLHAQDVVAGGAFIVTSRGDQFIYFAVTGDQSALVDRDEMTTDAGIGGLVVAGGDDPTGASGAWVCAPQFVEVSLYDGDATKAVNGGLEFLIPFRGDNVDRVEDAYFATLDFTGLTDAEVQEKLRKALIWQSQCQMSGGVLADNSSGSFDSATPALVWLTIPDWTRIDLDTVAYKFAPGCHPPAIQGEGGAAINTLITGVSHVAGTVANSGTNRWRDITVTLASAMDADGLENVIPGDLCALKVSGESSSGAADGPLYDGCWRVKSIAEDRLSLVVEGWMDNNYLPGTITGLTADGTSNGWTNNSISFQRNRITWSGGSAQVEGLFNMLHGGFGLTRYLAFDYQGTESSGSIYYCATSATWFGQSNLYFGAPERVYRGFDASNIRAFVCGFGRSEHKPTMKSMENQSGGHVNYKRCLGNADIIVGQDSSAEISQSTVRGQITANAGFIGTTDLLTVCGSSRGFYVQNGGRVVLSATTTLDYVATALDAIGGSGGGYLGSPVFGSNVTTQARMAANTIERGAFWQENSLKNPTIIPPDVTIADDDVWEAQVIGAGGKIELLPTRTPIDTNFASFLVDAVAAATTISGLSVGSGVTIVASTGGTDLGDDINNSADGTISVTVYEDGTDYYLQIANRSGSTIGYSAVSFGQMQIEAWTKRI